LRVTGTGASSVSVTRPESVAYWYPEPYWSDTEGEWLKTLLPFFDSVAILLPAYMYGRHVDANPWLAGPLEEQGLLHVLQPETFIDQEMTSDLCGILAELLSAGLFDDLEIPKHRYEYHELSQSRLGWNADLKLSSELIDDLERRHLALPSEDGVSVPLHPVIRTSVLVLLSQLAPRVGRSRGLELIPITPSRERIMDLLTFLRRPGMPSAGDVVGLDTEVVGLDLTDIPLNQVLAFREEHGSAYRSYARNVRAFTRDLSLLDVDLRESALIDRRQELADFAGDLRRQSRAYWKRPLARVALGGAGAALSFAAANPLPAVLAGAAALLAWEPQRDLGGAFSYLFEIQQAIS
jgi:hypothetical protein